MLRYLLILTSLFISETGLTQNDFPFPTDSVRWTRFMITGLQGINDYYDVYQTWLSGDTLFNDTAYTKVYSEWKCNCTCPSPGPSASWKPAFNPLLSIRGLRVSGDKVFLKNFPTGIEQVRYDFSLGINDTFWLGNYAFVVDTITTRPDGRRVWQLQHGDSWPDQILDTWVEGIGNLNGPTAQLFPSVSLSAYYDQGCFEHLSANTCTLPCSALSATGAVNTVDEWTFSASLAESHAMITCLYESRLFLRVFDAAGKICLQKNIASGEKIDLNMLPPGLYFLQAHSPGGRGKTFRWAKI